MLLGRVLLLTAAHSGRRRMAAQAQSCDAFEWHWLRETKSTQDAAKQILKQRVVGNSNGHDGKHVAVATAHQTAGRGTRGRTWKDDGRGNVALTVALDMRHLPLKPVTLVPLRVGVEVARVLADHLEDAPGCAVSLKWPNDVLLNGKKVCGVLIEADGDALLVGVGINVATHPDVPQAGPERGREATSLAACGATSADAEAIAKDLATHLSTWADGVDDAPTLVAHWSHFVDWSLPLTLRDTSEVVSPVRLLPDGRLRVRPAAGGPERDLVAEYLL